MAERRVSRDLGADLARMERVWDGVVEADVRAWIRAEWAADGWVLCGHPDCPPWNCRVTNAVSWP